MRGLPDPKEVFIAKHEARRAAYAEAHGIDESAIPDDVDSGLADLAYSDMTDHFAELADRAKDRAKELGQWPPR